MASIYSVAQINNYIKNMFTQDFLLGSVSIRGEISNCKYHSSGHIYFTLKDNESVLSCVMFSGNRKGLKSELENGQKVVVKGNINIYERDGKYQLYAKEIEPDGMGDLYSRFLKLKEELGEMGMFDPIYKKPVPKYCTKIGIVTAGTGAAIRDIVNITSRRNPHVNLFLYSAIVQGSGAVESVISGINCLDQMNLDVIIVGRGGGSIEDLWAFNDENVARAIFECNTPVISAVGHETDTTIADFVADLRAPTPSAAAELSVFDYKEFTDRLSMCEETMRSVVEKKIDFCRSTTDNLNLKLMLKSPENIIKDKRQEADAVFEKIDANIKNRIKDGRNRLMVMAEKLKGLSPLAAIKKGYGYVSCKNEAVRSISQVKTGDILNITVTDGEITAEVKDVKKAEINTHL